MSMDKATLSEAVVEAERFLKAAKKVRWEKKFIPATDSYPRLDYEEISHPEAAATRRASLDLTRALARLRKP